MAIGTASERTGRRDASLPLRASTKRLDALRSDYIGVLREGRVIVWECQHQHTERDIGPRSAYVCAAAERNRREAKCLNSTSRRCATT